MDLSGRLFKFLFRYRNKCNIILFNRLIHIFCHIKKVQIGKGVIFNGFPVIRRNPDSEIHIGDGCRFNSSKNSVLVNLTKPCFFITLGSDSEIVIGHNTGASAVTIVAAESVRIGSNVLIGANCTIVDNDFHHANPQKRSLNDIVARPVVIEDNVFLGFNCLILKGVTIGENAVIGANSVVINSIPANSMAIGNPCKVIMRRNWNR